MKIGLRDYDLGKSIGMMGTGQITRAINRSVNPYYGKKGNGKFKPMKYLYNQAYEVFTFGGLSQIKIIEPNGKRKGIVRVFFEKLLGL
ncbi:MAG: hypothetical protein ACRCXT_14285 [Paraclostridium sp.]